MLQLREDLSPEIVNSLTETDFGMWGTPEGTTFVNGMCLKLLYFVNPLLIKSPLIISPYRESRRYGTKEG